MAGMPGVGVVLNLSIGLKVSTTAASVLMVSMYLALWPIEAGRAENLDGRTWLATLGCADLTDVSD